MPEPQVVEEVIVSQATKSSRIVHNNLTVELEQVHKELVYDKDKIRSLYSSFTSKKSPTNLAIKVSQYEMIFRVELKNGKSARIKAHIYVPHNSSTKVPVFVFASGTTGLGQACAPTQESLRNAAWGSYTMHLVSQAAEGYAVIFPDYEGFDKSDAIQSYFIAETESRVLLGAVQAASQIAVEILPAQLDFKNIFLSGYSQGGHAALAAANERELLPTDKKVVGVVTYAAASNIKALLQDSPRLGPYIVYSYSTYYGGRIEKEKILQQHWLQKLDSQAGQWCIDEVFKKYPNTASEIYTPEFKAALTLNEYTINTPEFAEKLIANGLFQNLTEVPILSLQGASDPIVTAETQQANRAQLCKENIVLKYIEYPHTNHFQTRARGYFDTQKWMDNIRSGKPLESNCPRL